MSYLAFTKDLSRELGALQARADGRISTEDAESAHQRVFDRWLAENRHRELIAYLVSNYDGAHGGKRWQRLLGAELADANRPDLIRKLYWPPIQLRFNHYFWRRARLLPRWPMPKFIDRLLDRLDPRRLKLIEYKQSVLALMREYRETIAPFPAGNAAEIDQLIAAFIRDEVRLPHPAPEDRRRMYEEVFWALIADARASADTDIEMLQSLETRLAAFDSAEIEEFDAILMRLLAQSYRWDVWAVAYAVRGGCGDDAFHYFRSWLILQGLDVYRAALADPVAWAIAFPFEGDPQCEGLTSAAPNAYSRRTRGKKMPHRPTATIGEPAGEAWSEDELANRFPALASHFELSAGEA